MAKILLTGATGYLGSHILRMLLNDGHSAVILKRSFSNTKRIDDLMRRVKAYDIDKVTIKKIFDENSIDIIIHTATNYGRNGEPITEVVKTNLVFPLEILEYAAKKNVSLFINTGTSLPKELNYYEMSKRQFIEYAKIITTEYKINFINVKLEHLYGPGEDFNRFVPMLIRKMIRNEEVEMTKGEQERDFIYIDDAVSAYQTLIKNSKRFVGFKEIEVGSGHPIKIKKFARIIKSLTGSKSKIKFGAIPYRKNEPMYTCADTSLLNKLGWKPKHTIKEGLKIEVDYCKDEMKK
ncbi:MAG: NAD-dependent epimerase/dehydratase [Candidatus Woesearchaeota archaeon]